VGIPASLKTRFTLLPDSQNSQWHAERTTRRRHLLSLLSSDSINAHVNRDPLNVSLLTESRTWRDMPAITTGPSLLSASFSSPPSACLAVSLPNGRRDWVPTFRTVDPMDDLGVPSTPALSDIQISSPYHPSLALNGGGLPDGFSCHHLNPIRYIVREASHRPHSAWQARPRRDQQEHAVYSR